MATTGAYERFVLEQLELLTEISCKQMMGEYLIYYNGLLFGGIYNDILLVKIIKNIICKNKCLVKALNQYFW